MNKKLLLVNDMPGAAKVAANVNFPVLSAGQIEVSILPTLILSNYAGSPGPVVKHQIGQDFNAMLNHWEFLGLKFDAILTGYFGESNQIDEIISYYLKQSNQPKLLVDPTMGDLGKLYKGFDAHVVEKMTRLIQFADLVMPNITEACYLTNTPYKEIFTLEELTDIGNKLLALGAKNVAITGVSEVDTSNDQIGFYLIREKQKPVLLSHQRFPDRFFGTGDLAVSLLAVFYLAGFDIEASLVKTGKLIEEVLKVTLEVGQPKEVGLVFEPILSELYSMILKEKELN